MHERPLTTLDSEPVPDVMVVRGSPADFRFGASEHGGVGDRSRCVLIEIDRVKALIYAEAGVKEYWIVSPKEKQVEVYWKPGAQEVTQSTPSSTRRQSWILLRYKAFGRFPPVFS